MKPVVFETDDPCVRQYWLDAAYFAVDQYGTCLYLLFFELHISAEVGKVNPGVKYEWVDHRSLLGTTKHLRITVLRAQDWEDVAGQMEDVFYRAFPTLFEPSTPDLIECPDCDVQLPRYDYGQQDKHLREDHPEIANDGQRRAGFSVVTRIPAACFRPAS